MKACMTFTCETCKIWLMIKVLENDVYQVGQICSDLLHRTCYTAFRKPLYDYLWLVFCLNFNLLSSQSRASFCAAFS